MSQEPVYIDLTQIPGGVGWKFKVPPDPHQSKPSTDIDYTKFKDYETNVLEFFKPKECDVYLYFFKIIFNSLLL
jgi:hypothetical protein